MKFICKYFSLLIKMLCGFELSKPHKRSAILIVVVDNETPVVLRYSGNNGNAFQIGGNSTWTLKLLVDGIEIKKLFVRAKIEVFDEVFVAKSGIGKGDKIEEADLKYIKKNISRERVGYQTESKLIVGQQAKRSIQKNESVRKTLVEQPVLVRKGAPVTLVYKTKNVHFTNIVKALKEGKKGEIIPVRPLTGKRTIYAVVIDENNVRVAL